MPLVRYLAADRDFPTLGISVRQGQVVDLPEDVALGFGDDVEWLDSVPAKGSSPALVLTDLVVTDRPGKVALIRHGAGQAAFADGTVYTWSSEGDVVQVEPQHAEELLELGFALEGDELPSAPATEPLAEEAAAVGPPPKGGAGSGRDAWAAYAEGKVEVTDDMTRDDIITALDEAGWDTE